MAGAGGVRVVEGRFPVKTAFFIALSSQKRYVQLPLFAILIFFSVFVFISRFARVAELGGTRPDTT